MVPLTVPHVLVSIIGVLLTTHAPDSPQLLAQISFHILQTVQLHQVIIKTVGHVLETPPMLLCGVLLQRYAKLMLRVDVQALL